MKHFHIQFYQVYINGCCTTSWFDEKSIFMDEDSLKEEGFDFTKEELDNLYEQTLEYIKTNEFNEDYKVFLLKTNFKTDNIKKIGDDKFLIDDNKTILFGYDDYILKQRVERLELSKYTKEFLIDLIVSGKKVVLNIPIKKSNMDELTDYDIFYYYNL